jgi:anti-anti-sigma factor
MLLKFWGTRGSIPAPLRPDQIEQKIMAVLQTAGRQQIDLTNPEKIKAFMAGLSLNSSTVGSNTTCVTIELDGELIIFDAGSGIRELGDFLMDENNPHAKQLGFSRGRGHAYMFFTHTHWDHIQGFPFFKPLLIRGNVFDIHYIHDYVPDVLARQMISEVFPLQFDHLAATLNFHPIKEGAKVEVAGAAISNIELKHPGRAFAYRVEANNNIAILATDGEYQNLDYATTNKYVKFYANADVLIFDAMFSVRDSFVKEDWGHSSALIGADIAGEANVKRLVLFHHDPAATDAEIMRVLQTTREYLGQRGGVPEVIVACEGLEINLTSPPRLLSDFAITDKLTGNVLVMTLFGRFSAHTIEHFRDHLNQQLDNTRVSKVILHMENLNDLTIAGIQALVDARKNVVSLALVCVPENIYRVFQLSGTTDFFAIYDDLDSALMALNSHLR